MFFAYLPPLKVACTKGFGDLAAIAAEFKSKKVKRVKKVYKVLM